MQSIDAGALESQLDPIGVNVVASDGALAKEIKDARRGRELANTLLWLGIIVFIAQSVLAKYFTNKMSKEDTEDLSATLQMSRVAAARRS